uniref:Deoxynucleotidyltransferase, terminal, interacting protein 2 n=1 Tax=Schistosoma japonicum TaxID=6182 RepID=Q5D9A4_SCHJA|nr:SJCHGC05744 protein [Schistosoma japonicum]CAX69950.1 deoxynucleotidyltransferase, terminal, interacting protein 2 [Schistosoma japonicum]
MDESGLSFIPYSTSYVWKPPLKLTDCSSEYLRICSVDYSLMENPFSSKLDSFDAKKEKKLWERLGVLISAINEGNCEKPPSENPYFLTSMPGLHSKRELKRIRRAERKSKLSKWFNLPKPDITEEERDDLELIRLRRAISSDTHVRRSDGKSAYFQRGVVVDDPGSFYDRLPRKQRGKTLVDELLANAEIMKVQRKRYAKIARTIAEKRAAVRRREQQRIKRLQSGRKKQQATVVVPD